MNHRGVRPIAPVDVRQADIGEKQINSEKIRRGIFRIFTRTDIQSLKYSVNLNFIIIEFLTINEFF